MLLRHAPKLAVLVAVDAVIERAKGNRVCNTQRCNSRLPLGWSLAHCEADRSTSKWNFSWKLKPESGADDEANIKLVEQQYLNPGHKNYDPTKGAELLKRVVVRRDARVQNMLGFCYWRGLGVAENKEEAARYFKLAADQGSSLAQFNLGECYRNGFGVALNKEEAVRYYKLAADQRHVLAQYFVGVAYAKGDGVARNDDEAVRYFHLAADQGLPGAQFTMGELCASGFTVPQNFYRAAEFYRKAAAQGHPGAMFQLGNLYRTGNGVPKNLSNAHTYIKRSADMGYVPAQFSLAFFADVSTNESDKESDKEGERALEDQAEAVKYMKMAADQGHRHSAFLLGRYYIEGTLNPEKNIEEGMRYLRFAAKHGDVLAQTMIGLYLWEGKHIPQDKAEGLRLLKLSDEQGCEAARKLLATFNAGDGDLTQQVPVEVKVVMNETFWTLYKW